MLILPFMKTCISRARLSVMTLALVAAFPVLAQSQATPTLNDVVVTATRFPESAASLPFGVSVITADEIQASGVNSVNEAVMKLLGVPGRLDTSGGNNYTLDLRGFGETANSNQVVIVDGLRMNEGDLSAAGLAHISIDSVERIEVLRGTGSVLYGEGATGGVIVVTTKAGMGVKRVNSAQLYAATGSNGLQDARANVVLASGGFSLDVAADDRRSDGHRENFSSASNGLNMTSQWSNDWLRVGVRVGQNSLNSGLPGSLSANEYATDPQQANVASKTDKVQIKKDNAGIFVEANVGGWQLAADANQRTKKYLSYYGAYPYGYDVDASNYSARARHDIKGGIGENSLIVGHDNGTWKSKSTTSQNATVSRADSLAYYIKDDFTLSSTKTRLSLGLRTEKMKKSIGVVLPLSNTQSAWELGLSQPVANNLLVYGRVGNSFRLANLDEMNGAVANTVLLPQTSRDVELGGRWAGGANQVELRFYRSVLNNEIGLDPTIPNPGKFWSPNVNFDPTQRQGLELEAKHALRKSLDFRLNAALREAKFTAGAHAGKDMALVPNQTIALHADWRPVAGHSLNAGVNWVSSQNADFDNTCKIPAYTTVDARYAYQFRNAEFALGVANLMDEKYYTQAYGCAAGVTTSIYPEAGRSFTASLRVKF